ncbi:CPBP family intramembrane metalloprotease [candidate division KSB1 bacterium]|nr:CPBP family intramembrane metalloprotease [candidate division KSB1 bacterium]
MHINFRKIISVYKKESLETLRDRRTLFVMIFVPLILYPLLFTVMSQVMTLSQANSLEQPSVVTIVPTVPAALDSMIRSHPDLVVMPSRNPFTALQSRDIDAYIQLVYYGSKDSFQVCFDATLETSRTARQRLTTILEQYSKTKHPRKTAYIQVPPSVATGSINVMPPSHGQAMIIGGILPVLLIVTLMFGALYPAIDLTAGEKERGTLETVLTVPIHRLELLMGKFLTVTTFALLTGALNLISMGLTYGLGLLQLNMLSDDVSMALSPTTMTLLFILLIPLSLFISAVMLSVSLFARSFKEAQNMATPFYMLLLFPAMFAMLPEIRLTAATTFVPILNVSLLFKEILLQTYTWESVGAVLLSNIIFAFLSIALISKLFNAEEILFSEGSGWEYLLRRPYGQKLVAISPAMALIVFSVVMLLIFYIGSIIQLKWLQWGVLLTQWGLILLPVLLIIKFQNVNFRSAIQLHSFTFRQFAGTILLTLGGLGVISILAQLQAYLFPSSKALEDTMQQMLQFDSLNMTPLIGFLIFAVSPAICEEFLFRGLLLSSFKQRMHPALAIGLVGALFGIFHIYLFRMLPTAVLGISLSYIVYRSGSIYLGMISHALHNGLALLLISYPAIEQFTNDLSTDSTGSLLIIAGMGVSIISGLWLLQGSRVRETGTEDQAIEGLRPEIV